jgi:transposase InsO family protein
MSFETRTVMEQRLELVKLAIQRGSKISWLSKRFGVSRRVCYKWIQRFKEGGIAGLQDKSRRPHTSPGQTGKDIEEKIISIRRKNPEWGARKLQVLLLKQNIASVPSSSTITAILHRNDLISQEKSQKQKATKRFEYASPNELWQMDFKGYFKMLNNARCFPLTILDDHSRFSVCLKACLNQQANTVQDQLIGIFRKYGLPDKILTDNGSPWGSAGNVNTEGETALSSLEIWLMRLHVKVIHGRPYHPQTQGKEERFHRTLKTELLQYEEFRNINDCQKRFDKWRNKYNQERPHCSIGFKTPSDLYTHSQRSYPETLPPIEYFDTDEVKKVYENGSIFYKKQKIKVGKGLKNQLVAIRSTALDDVKEVFFCNQKLKDIIVSV